MSRLEPQARAKSTEAVMGDARPNWLPWLIIRLLIQTIRQDRSGSIWTDDPSDVSRPDRSGSDQIEVAHQATDLMLVGRCFGCRLLGLEAGGEDVDAELELVLGGDACQQRPGRTRPPTLRQLLSQSRRRRSRP